MAKILNTLFGSFGVFALCFVWIVYCTSDSSLALWLSVVTAAAAGYLVYRCQCAYDSRKRSKRIRAAQISSLADTLRYGQNNAALFSQMLQFYRFTTEQVDFDDLIAEKNGKKSYVALRYTSDNVSREELARTVVQALRCNCDGIYLFAHKVDSTALLSAQRHIDITFADIANVYTLLDRCGKLPPPSGKDIRAQPHFAARIVFARRRFGMYLGMSLFMTLLSAVSLVKWYTLTWATVGMIAAFYCLLNRRFNNPPTAVTLS